MLETLGAGLGVGAGAGVGVGVRVDPGVEAGLEPHPATPAQRLILSSISPINSVRANGWPIDRTFLFFSSLLRQSILQSSSDVQIRAKPKKTFHDLSKLCRCTNSVPETRRRKLCPVHCR